MSITQFQSVISAAGGFKNILNATKDPLSQRVGIDQTVGTVYGSWDEGGSFRGNPIAACWNVSGTMEIELETGVNVGSTYFAELTIEPLILEPPFTLLTSAGIYNYSAPYARWTWSAGFNLFLNGRQYEVILK